MDSDPQPWEDYSQPLVRDLAWCVFSPELITTDCNDIDSTTMVMRPEDAHYLRQLDSDPSPLLQWMDRCKSPRLGLRFEAFWQFWITQRLSEETEHRFNLQINAPQQTLGELDAIAYCNPTQRLTHRELAVKFYLGTASHCLPLHLQPPEARFCWVGPNIKDRLDLKREQILHRQLNLLHQSPEARNALPSHWQWQSLQRQAIVKGRLFYPRHSDISRELQQGLGSKHLRGTWLHFSELKSLKGDHWLVLKRRQWFAPVAMNQDAHRSDQPLSLSSLSALLANHFETSRQPIQIASMKLEDNVWREEERLFVVPDHWPSTT